MSLPALHRDNLSGDIPDAFCQAMQNAGIEPPVEIIADGTLHRFTVAGDKARSDNGWYVLHADHPAAGAFGCWKRQINETWCAKSCQTMTPAEKGAYTAKLEAMKRQRDEERDRVQAECRAWCSDAWEKAKDADNQNPYLKRKRVHAYGVKACGDSLIVPVMDTAGTIHGLQFISPDGSKKFKTGTNKAGHFFKIGETRDRTVLICEGFATGASLHQATGHCVVVAFDAGNLKPVAEGLRAKCPDCKIIICADDDYATEGNPGLAKARAAAQSIGGKLAVPVFQNTPTRGTDLNDLHQAEGFEAVHACIEGATQPVSRQADTWPEPLSLPDGLPPVKSLDPIMIPAPLRDWLMDISDRMQIPSDFSTAAAVVALGSIIGHGCGIYPKRRDDWLVVPNLWGAVVGRPSLMKTPAISEAQRHLIRLETEAREEYQGKIEAFSLDMEIKKLTRAAISEEIKRAVKKELSDDIERARQRLAALQTDEPTRRRYQTQDTTVEKIGELLNENPRGILINRDELIGWFRSLDRDGHEGDRAFYLEAWNGTQAFTYDRIGRGTLDIQATCVSIFGAIVPGTLSHYVNQANRGGNGDDGLLQRFQVIVWPDAPTEWRNVDRFPDTAEKNRAWQIFKALSGDIPGAVKEEGADIPALRFSPGGQEIFDTWRTDLEIRLRGDHGLPPAMESHLTKYRKLMPALALIFHVVDMADGKATGPVSETAALMAAAWCDYLETHAGRLYGAAITPGMDAAREIVKHIRRGAVKDGMRFRDIHRNQWARLTTPEDVRAGIEVLQEYDWLEIKRTTTGGRPSEVICPNPRIKV